MNHGNVFGRYEYRRVFAISRTVLWVTILTASGSMIRAGGLYAYFAVPLLAAAVLMFPLIVKYWTYAMTIEETVVAVEHFRHLQTLSLADIVSVRVRAVNTEEAVYVRDRVGNKFSFERGLDKYEDIKEFLVEVSRANNLEDDERRVLGRHEYHHWYKVVCGLSTVVVWCLLAMAVPSSLLAGELDLPNDLNALAVSALLLAPALMLPFVLLRVLTFRLTIGQDSIRSQWWRAKREVLLRNIAGARVNDWLPFQELWIELVAILVLPAFFVTHHKIRKPPKKISLLA